VLPVVPAALSVTVLVFLLRMMVHGQPEVVAIRNVTIVDPRSGTVTKNATLVVGADRVEFAGRSPNAKFSTTRAVDGAGLFVLPVLWDMHTHINEDDPWAFPLLVASGVMGVRDMGATLEDVQRWRAADRAGEIVPDLRGSGPILTGRVDDSDPRVKQVATPASAVATLRDLFAANVDHVKVHDWLSLDTWRTILKSAQGTRIPVVGHLPIRSDALEAIDSGQRSIEHFGHAWGGFLLDVSIDEQALKRELRAFVEQARSPLDLSRFTTRERWARIVESYSEEKARLLAIRLARKATFVCPTLYSFGWLAQAHIGPPFANDSRLQFLPPSRQTMLKKLVTAVDERSEGERGLQRRVYDTQVRLLTTFAKHGVLLLAGTDYAQYPLLFPGLSLYDELRTLVEAGLTPLSAIRTATANVGRYLGDDRVGCVAAGCAPNLLLIEGDPLQDIESVSRVRAVIRRGRYIAGQEREALLERARRRAERASH